MMFVEFAHPDVDSIVVLTGEDISRAPDVGFKVIFRQPVANKVRYLAYTAILRFIEGLRFYTSIFNTIAGIYSAVKHNEVIAQRLCHKQAVALTLPDGSENAVRVAFTCKDRRSGS